LRYKGISLAEIAAKVQEQFKEPEEFELITSDESDPNPVIRVRLRLDHISNKDKKAKQEMEEEEKEEEKLGRMSSIMLDDMVRALCISCCCMS
jgi:hypothetical protein